MFKVTDQTPANKQLSDEELLDMQEELSEQGQAYAALQDMGDILQYTQEDLKEYAVKHTEATTRETILRVIMGAHNGKEILARAAEIQAGLWVTPFAPTSVMVSASEKRRMANDGGNWMEIIVPVLEVDPYSLDAPYFIKYPNGETDWVKGR